MAGMLPKDLFTIWGINMAYQDLFGFDRFAQAQDMARQWQRQQQQDEMALSQMRDTQRRNALAERYATEDRQREADIRNAMSQPIQTGGPLRDMQEYKPIGSRQPSREELGQRLMGLGEYEQALKFMPDEVKPENYTLTPGSMRFGPNNQVIASVPKESKFDAFVDKIDMGDKVRAWKPDGTYEDFPKKVSPSTILNQDTRRATDEMGIRKEFLALPEVKSHVEITSQVQRLEKAMAENAKGGSKVAVDQALITILNKMLDPSSVVRESEYARTPGDLAFLNRMRGKVEKLKTGGAGLTDEDRTAIAAMARTFSDVSQSMYNEQEQYYSGLAQRYGYNPENVVRLGGAAARDKNKTPPKSKELKSGDVEDGYRYIGGDKASPASWKKVK